MNEEDIIQQTIFQYRQIAKEQKRSSEEYRLKAEVFTECADILENKLRLRSDATTVKSDKHQ